MIPAHTKEYDRTKTGFNILLVEDNATDALLIQSYIKVTDFSLQTVETVSQALECLGSKDFDVVLLDLNLPDALGLESLIKLRHYVRVIPIVVLTAVDDKELGIMALQRGAQDYLVKGVDNGRLTESIRYAIERMLVRGQEESMANQHYYDIDRTQTNFSPVSVMERDRKVKQYQVLTERELQVLKLLGTGCSNQEIANRLAISVTTVKTHMGSILQKLLVSDRTNAVIAAHRQGLL